MSAYTPRTGVRHRGKRAHPDEHLSSGFACRVRVGRLQRALFCAGGAGAVADLAVHLVRADVHEALDRAAQPRSLEQRVRAIYVVLRE